MSGTIIPLTRANFSVSDKHLTMNIPGIVLVYFKQTNCNSCKLFDNIFNVISSTERRIKYAVIVLDGVNRDVARIALETRTPISGTPMLLLYGNGKPQMRYTGAKNVPSIVTFIGKSLEALQPSNSYSTHQQPPLGMHQQQIQQAFSTGPTQQQQQHFVDDEADNGYFEPVGVIPKNRPWNTLKR